ADWDWVFFHIDRLLRDDGVVLIHHPVTSGARMVQMLKSIPQPLLSSLPQHGVHGVLQEIERKGWREEAADAAMSLPDICKKARSWGLHYLMDGVSYRDFLPQLPDSWKGYPRIEQNHLHDVYTMRLWRDSIFTRRPPEEPCTVHADKLRIVPRIANMQSVPQGFVYQTFDGISLGLSHRLPLEGILADQIQGALDSVWRRLIFSAAIDLERVVT
ncbi:MAG: hypothetical protein VX278_14665, partial [Myxococcota bacterium]|nr:hypothetical protein [Myxococcota bacterium]